MSTLFCHYNKRYNSYMLANLSHINSSPFGKFFLLVFAQNYGNRSPRIESTKAFSRYMGLPKVKLYETLRELRGEEILQVDRSSQGELPWVQYQISAPDIALKVRENLRQHKHSTLITQLLRWGQDRLENRPHQLTIPQRILLIALLEHADQAGVVRKTGFGELSKQCGLTIRQVKNQIRLLTQYHYIRCSTTGGNNPRFIGRFDSTYLLNLRHPNYGNDIKSGDTVICRQAVPWPWANDENLNIASRLRHQLLQLWPRLAKHLQRKPTTASWQFLHWSIYDLASKSLTENWNELTESTYGAVTKQLATEVQKLCFPIPNPTDDELADAILEFCQCVAGHIFSVASGAKEILSACSTPTARVKDRCYQILPPRFRDERSACLAIEVFDVAKGHSPRHRSWKVKFDLKQGKPVAEEIDGVDLLDFRELSILGIATPPLHQPTLYRVKARKSD
jgi:hypothetical protein